MKKKLMVCFLAAVMAVSAAACGGSGSGDTKKETVSEDSSKDEDEGKDDADSGEEVSVEEQVLVEWEEGVTITLTGMTNTSRTSELNFSVENNSSHNIFLSATDICVNTCYLDSGYKIGPDIPAGQTGWASLSPGGDVQGKAFLENMGIDVVGSVECKLSIHDADVDASDGTSSLLYISDTIEIQTSAYDDMDTEAWKDGTELYNQDGLRIVAKQIGSYNALLSGYGLYLYAENTTGKDLQLEGYDIAVNDAAVVNEMSGMPQGFSWSIPAGKNAAQCLNMSYDSNIADESAIGDITSIKFGLVIYEAATADTWTGTGVIGDTGILTYTP